MFNNKDISIYIIAIIASMGGLLFGFDMGVLSGAIPFLQLDWHINNNIIEMITASSLLGAVLGAMISGRIVETIGRKKVITVASLIFVVGTILSSISVDAIFLIFSRFISGIAIGIISFVVPLYIAEISPNKIRGSLVALFQLMVSVGLLLSYLSDLILADNSDLTCWRNMFYVDVITGLILLFGVLFLPESPRWLINKGFIDEARMILFKFCEKEEIDECVNNIILEKKQNDRNVSWRELFTPMMKYPMIIVIGIMFFQQFIGINTVIYYSPKIFLMAGFDGPISAIAAAVGIGVMNVIFTIISAKLVDKLGRRKLYFTGLVGINISLCILSISFMFSEGLGNWGKWLDVACLFSYVSFFSLSIGPLAWLIVSEVFPMRLRAYGSSLGSFVMWVFNTLVSFTFFKLVKFLSFGSVVETGEGEILGNPAGAFLFYAIIALLGIIWGYFYLPETKGLSLEKIEKFWKQNGKPINMKKVLRS